VKKLKNIPSNKISRASKLAVAGLKVGKNYLKHYSKKINQLEL